MKMEPGSLSPPHNEMQPSYRTMLSEAYGGKQDDSILILTRDIYNQYKGNPYDIQAFIQFLKEWEKAQATAVTSTSHSSTTL